MTIPADGTTWTPIAHGCAAAAAGVSACLAGVLIPRARGTTLLAPLLWLFLSLTFLTASEAWVASAGEGGQGFGGSLIRYAAAAGLFTPIMALLGAKRPQDRGWQWIVASLWLVLIWPALQGLATASAERVELFTAWRLFLCGLLCLTPLNYVPTRFRSAALLATVGHATLLYEWIAQSSVGSSGLRALVGSSLVLLAVGAVTRSVCASRTRTPEIPDAEESAWFRSSERWIAFRDAFGAFWALRIMQRVNQTAALQQWPVRLDWGGFRVPGQPGDPRGEPTDLTDLAETNDQIDQTLDTLLRRYF